VVLTQILSRRVWVRLALVVLAACAVVSAYQCAEQYLVSNQVTIEQYEESPEILLEPLGIDPGTFQHFLFEHRLYSRGIRGFFTTSNSAASFALLAAFAAVILLVRGDADHAPLTSRLRSRLAPIAGATIVIVGLLLTQSKGGTMAFLMGGVAFGLTLCVRSWFAARAKPVLAGTVLLGVLFVAAVTYALISYGLEHGRLPGGNSMLVRWQYWEASARMYADHPVTGVGPGNFASYYPHYKPPAALESVADPHNFILSFLTQYGPLGLLGFLAMVFVPLGRAVASGFRAPADEERPAGPSFKTSSLAILAMVAVCLLVLRPLLIPSAAAGSPGVLLYEFVTVYVAPVAALLIGFLLLAAPLENKTKWEPRVPRAVLVAALVSAILGVLLHNLIDFALFEPGVWTAFWLVLACLASTPLEDREEPPPTRQIAPAWKLTAGIVTALLIGAYGSFVWKPVQAATSYTARAHRAAALGQFDEVHRLLEAAFAADPLAAAPLNLNGRLYVQQYEQTGGNQSRLLREALDCFLRATQVRPADYKNYEKLGMVYALLGQWQESYDWYLKTTKLYPGCGRIWFHLAEAAEQIGKDDAAALHYCRAIEIEDSYRRQFQQMYPKRDKVVSRIGEENYRRAKERLEALSR
jgi:O-antigen ligase